MLSVYKYVCRRLKMCGYPPGLYYDWDNPCYDFSDKFREEFYNFTDMFFLYAKYEETTDYLTFFMFFITLLCLIVTFVALEKLEKRVQSLEKDHPLLEPLLAV